jgi:hypothetical protein
MTGANAIPLDDGRVHRLAQGRPKTAGEALRRGRRKAYQRCTGGGGDQAPETGIIGNTLKTDDRLFFPRFRD